MIRLNKKQILILHSQLIEKFGGIKGVRDESLLDSALSAPFQSYGDEELFPSIQAKAARLCFGIVKNHAMMDGNKRLGAHTMLVFLELNGCHLEYSQDELIEIILGIASGKSVADDLLYWIIDHQI